jgi:tetratricopeptide (TPR) repeat protein
MPSITQSIEKLQKKLDKDPNSHVFFQLAEEHRKEGNFDQAIRILKTGLGRHPNYWSARVTLGRIYHQMGNSLSAREELEKVIQAVPDNLLANRLLGDIYTANQLPAEALKRYRIVQMLTPADPEVGALIQRLESEVAEPEVPKPLAEVPVDVAPEPEEEQSSISVEEEQEEEIYAPTVQIQIPDFLDKTEVPVGGEFDAPQEPELAEEAIVTELPSAQPPETTAPTLILNEVPATDFEPAIESSEEVEEVESLTPDTLILDPPIETFEEEIFLSPEEDPFAKAKDAEELSTLANLLLSTEPDPADFEELEENPSIKAEAFERDPQHDRTQPIQEGEEDEQIQEVEELTSETLAELYVNQGFIDKAMKVYQRLLFNDPENEKIAQRLKELESGNVMAEPKQEMVYNQQEQELLLVEPDGSEAVGDIVARRDQERRRKINTLEHWLTTIRRDRD